MTGRAIDLNADLGEGEGKSRILADLELLGLVTSANVACGYHAGDDVTMRDTVRAAAALGVRVGAHPSYPDRDGFGRRDMELAPRELTHHLLFQLRALRTICESEGTRISYVKPHGALYNRAVRDPVVAGVVAKAISSFDSSLTLLGLAGSAMLTAAEDAGLRAASEAFADRGYQRDGQLVPRDQAGAILGNPEQAGARAVRMVTDGVVAAVDGALVALTPDSICVHGDGAHALEMLHSVKRAMTAAGIRIAPFCK